jgi:CheY-like chemotaxis protein
MEKKVLIVDDEPEQIDFASALLEEHGYIPLAASDGIEGMEKAKTEKPDLILLDVLMPKRGGIGMYEDLKQDKETKNIPVVIITGVAQTAYSGDFILSRDEDLPPPDGFVEKPMNPDAVLKLVRDLLA